MMTAPICLLKLRNWFTEDFVGFDEALHFHNSLKKIHNQIRNKRIGNILGKYRYAILWEMIFSLFFLSFSEKNTYIFNIKNKKGTVDIKREKSLPLITLPPSLLSMNQSIVMSLLSQTSICSSLTNYQK